jgi:hypothetical protein
MLSDNIGNGFFVNIIASINLFAISNVASWCCGMFRALLDLFGTTSALADGACSNLDNLCRRHDIWHLSSGGDIAGGRFRVFGNGGHASTVSAGLNFVNSGTLGFVMTCPSAPDLDDGPLVDDPNHLL